MESDCGTPIRFEACWDRAREQATATAYPDQITISVDGHELEIPLDLFDRLTAQLIVAAHTSRPPPSVGGSAGAPVSP